MGKRAEKLDDVYEADNPEGVFEVTFSRGFWLGVYPITQCQWHSVMESSPSKFQGVNFPVDEVSWKDAKVFCERLNARNLALPDNFVFDLPTEAQWEYACCGGTTYKYQRGNSIEDLSQVAWHRENVKQIGPQSVGQKEPNNWGLYDMLGNVAEWCLDEKGDYPVGTKQIDWIGRGNNSYTSELRAARGGNFLKPPNSQQLTCTGRFFAVTDPVMGIGFRVCLRYKET